MQLSWEEVPSASQNGIIRGYTLIIAPQGISSDNNNGTRLGPNVFSYEVTGLMPNSVYNISLAAHTSAGVGPMSSVQVSLLPEGKY